jgi:hypothetical protein
MLLTAHVSAAGGDDTNDPLGSNRAVHANIGVDLLRGRLGVGLGPRAWPDLPTSHETPGNVGRGLDAAEVRTLEPLCLWARNHDRRASCHGRSDRG